MKRATPAEVESICIDLVDPMHPQALALLGEAALEARALYPELFKPDSPAPTNLPLAEREIYLLAHRDGTAVGCGALRCIDRRVGEVRRMYVTQGARRSGIARALLERLEQEAQALGYQRLRLETGAHQKPALALYKAAGWRRIPGYGPFVGDPMSLCFGKRLA